MGFAKVFVRVEVIWGFWKHPIYLACNMKGCVGNAFLRGALVLIQLRPTTAHQGTWAAVETCPCSSAVQGN